jgi:hypothetical protein
MANPVNAVDPEGLAQIMVDPNSPMGRRMADMSPLEKLLFPLDLIMPMSVGVKGLGAGVKGAGATAEVVAEALHNHHVFVQAFRSQFARAGIAIDKYLVRIPASWHQRWVHSLGARGGQWNRAWLEFFERNPNATAEEIWEQLYKMLETIGLCAPK